MFTIFPLKKQRKQIINLLIDFLITRINFFKYFHYLYAVAFVYNYLSKTKHTAILCLEVVKKNLTTNKQKILIHSLTLLLQHYHGVYALNVNNTTVVYFFKPTNCVCHHTQYNFNDDDYYYDSDDD